jgi:hypothetical protein
LTSAGFRLILCGSFRSLRSGARANRARVSTWAGALASRHKNP